MPKAFQHVWYLIVPHCTYTCTWHIYLIVIFQSKMESREPSLHYQVRSDFLLFMIFTICMQILWLANQLQIRIEHPVHRVTFSKYSSNCFANKRYSNVFDKEIEFFYVCISHHNSDDHLYGQMEEVKSRRQKWISQDPEKLFTCLLMLMLTVQSR